MQEKKIDGLTTEQLRIYLTSDSADAKAFRERQTPQYLEGLRDRLTKAEGHNRITRSLNARYYDVMPR